MLTHGVDHLLGRIQDWGGAASGEDSDGTEQLGRGREAHVGKVAKEPPCGVGGLLDLATCPLSVREREMGNVSPLLTCV